MKHPSLRLAGLWLVLVAGAAPAPAGPAIQFIDHSVLTLEVRPLTAATVESNDDAFRLRVEERRPAALDLLVLWPEADNPSRLRLAATRELTIAGERVQLEAELIGADGRPISRASREMLFTSDTATALFEVARKDGRVLTLAIEGELTNERRYSARPVIGAPVSFELEIRWLERGQGVTLETNWLNTFVGQEVSYAFRLGETGQAAALSLKLLPARLIGDTLQIEVELDGTLPDEDSSLTAVARREQWLATANTTSTLSLAQGEPPTGFQFLVTTRY